MSERKDWHSIVAESLAPLIPTPERGEEQGARLVEDLGLDSLDIVLVTMDIENELRIEISDEDQELWITVGDIVRFCEAKAGAGR